MRLILVVVAAGCGTSPVTHDAGLVLRDAPETCVDRATNITPAHVHAGVDAGDPTFAGQSCIVGGCHLAKQVGAGAQAFEFAGTVYGDDLVTPNRGITVRIVPFLIDGATAVTDSAGNFFILDGTLSNPFPGRSQATVCPTLQQMPSDLVDGTGDCNQAGCHAVLGLMPVHVSPVM